MRLALLALALLLPACDSFCIGDCGDYGEFTATVSGALGLDLHGTAQVYQYPDTTFAKLYLNITNDFARYITLTTADTTALVVGRYALGDGTLHAIEYQVDNLDERTFAGVSGSMTISEIDGAGDAFGQFEFVAVDSTDARVAVRGAFRARDRRRTYGRSE